MNPRMEFHTVPEWQSREVTSVNCVPAHTKWEAYLSAEEAAAGQPSSAKISLNGIWKFRLLDCPEQAGDFYRTDASEEGFSDILVPGSWEVQGFGKPIYTNYFYPWDYNSREACMLRPAAQYGKQVPNPPFVPRENPTGCYRTAFDLPEDFAGKDVFLRFDGVETAYYLWVNGQPAGYAEDSKLPSEFDVTALVKPGRNQLALQVMRFSKSSYLEDQDYWHLSGIHRNVWLIAKPKKRIEDYKIEAMPDLLGNGTVRADIRINRFEDFADCRVRLSLYDADGALLAEDEGDISPEAGFRQDLYPTANSGHVELRLPAVQLWSPEQPTLYRAVVSLLSPDGTGLDWEGCDIGFKKVEIRDGVVLLNGQRLIVRGVNRHDFCWKGGRTVSREHMIEEIRQMKRMNINAVRTCHYPDCPEWYDLCDELGILLVCECDLETHGVSGALSHDPAWALQYLDRGVRMVLFYKNHPSIFSWSLGNESGTGPNHAAMAGFIREYDKTRLCQYEAGEPGKNISDVRGNMYASIPQILQMLADPNDDRPIILVEYLYQISNSGGGMDKFRAMTERYPRFQGGFIWDWQDKALCKQTADGKDYFAYGGDFGEPVVDWEQPPYMTNNGIVQADLRWKPVAFEVKEGYAPVWFEKPTSFSAWETVASEEVFLLKNRTMTEWGRDFRCEAVLRENGAEVARWEQELPDLPPMSQKMVTVKIPYSKKADCEYYLEFILLRKTKQWYAEQGETVGVCQFELAGGLYTSERMAPSGCPVALEETDALFLVKSAGFTAAFSKKTGGLVSLKQNGVEYLAGELRLCVDRPRSGLDVRSGWGWKDILAKLDGMEPHAGEAAVLCGKDRVRLDFPWQMTSKTGVPAEGTLCYTVRDGAVETEFTIRLPESFPLISRAGIELVLAPGFEEIRSYSRGPMESYCDRKLCSGLQVWDSTVSDQHFPFSPPSECGGHEDARWLLVKNQAGHSLYVTADRPFHFDIRHYANPDYEAAHDHELPEREESWLHLDAVHGPIGGDMAWSTGMAEEYRLSGGTYSAKLLLELSKK